MVTATVIITHVLQKLKMFVKVVFFICKYMYQFYLEVFRISKCILLVWEELKEVNANFRYIRIYPFEV